MSVKRELTIPLLMRNPALVFSTAPWDISMVIIQVSFENEVCGVKQANNFAIKSHMNTTSKRNQMINFELNGSSGNVITRVEDSCHGYKISIATKITPASFYH